MVTEKLELENDRNGKQNLKQGKQLTRFSSFEDKQQNERENNLQ